MNSRPFERLSNLKGEEFSARVRPAHKIRRRQWRDAEEFAEPSAINGGPNHRDEKEQRQERRRGRHEHHTSSQADGGFGSGGANSSFFPRMRRSAQAIGS